MTWETCNHLSLLPTIIKCRAKGEPFLKEMFAADVLNEVKAVELVKVTFVQLDH